MAATPGATKRTLWAWALATWFGAGYLKPGPGTYGSVAAVVLWFLAANLFHLTRILLTEATWIAAAVTLVVGIYASDIVARESARKDPGFVVIDEVCGQLVALALMRPDWQHALIALILFRLFDIWKPWPIRRIEALPGGAGIMLDDFAAGLLALVVGVILSSLIPNL